jgi:hypothetical protein
LYRHIIIAILFFATLNSGKLLINKGDGYCPSKYILMSPEEALSRQSEICNKLNGEKIGRLGSFGSIDGYKKSYGCGIRKHDTRVVSLSVCVKDFDILISQDTETMACPKNFRLIQTNEVKANHKDICSSLKYKTYYKLANGVLEKQRDCKVYKHLKVPIVPTHLICVKSQYQEIIY